MANIKGHITVHRLSPAAMGYMQALLCHRCPAVGFDHRDSRHRYVGETRNSETDKIFWFLFSSSPSL